MGWWRDWQTAELLELELNERYGAVVPDDSVLVVAFRSTVRRRIHVVRST